MPEIHDALKKISLFSTLSDEMIDFLSKEVHELFVKQGAFLFKEGDKGDALYFILEGSLEVVNNIGNDREIVLAKFQPGEYFGEMALLDDKPRSASVRAITDCRLLALDREDFAILLEKNPSISLQLSRVIANRLRKSTPFATREIPQEVSEEDQTVISGVRVFISYSRKNKTFVQKLHKAIEGHGLDVWVDWENIPLTADWWAEIQRGIDNADAFAFILSPDSLQSRICGDEIQAAVNNHKRLIPIVFRDPGKDDQIHPSVAATNWIFMRTDEELEGNLPKMLQVVNTDLDWVQDHTRLSIRAGEWTRSGRDTSFLLRGKDLENAELWLTRSEKIPDPKPTALHHEYINASIQETKNARLTARRQRIFLGSISFALLVTLIMTILAGISYVQAEESRQLAEDNLNLANTAQFDAEENEAFALLQRATAEVASTDAIYQQQIALTQEQIAKSEANAASTARVEAENQKNEADVQRDLADSQRATAQAAQVDAVFQRDLAISRQRAAQAIGLLDSAPELAALLSLEAYNTSPSFEAKSAILTVLQRRLNRRIVPLRPIPDQPDGVYSIAFSPDGERLAFGLANGYIVIWNYIERTVEVNLQKHSGRVIRGLAFSPDGQFLATGADDTYVRVWNIETFSEVSNLLAGSPVLSVTWNNDGTRIAAVAGPRVIVWTVSDEKKIYDKNLNYALNALDWSPDGSKIAAASALRWVYVLDAETGNTLATLQGHTADVQTVAWAPDSNILASGGEDNTVLIWDINQGQGVPIATLLRHTDQVFSVDFSLDGKILASGSEDRTIKLWDMDTFQFTGEIDQNNNSVQDVAFNSQSSANYLATASRDKTVGFYELFTDQPLSESILSNGGQIKTLILKGENIVEGIGISQSTSNLLKFWQVGENSVNPEAPVTTISAQNGKVFAMSTDGISLSAGYDDGTIKIINVETDEVIQEFNQSGKVYALAFSPNQQRLASSQCMLIGSEQGTSNQSNAECSQSEITVWDLSNGEPIWMLSLPDQSTGLIEALAFSGDGNKLASGSNNQSILLWDLTTGQPIGLPLTRHRAEITALAFSPDSLTLASGSAGSTIILWDLVTYQPIGEPLVSSTGSVLSLLFNPDGTILYSGDFSGSILKWDLDINSWYERVCSLAGRNLTEAEWSQYIPNQPIHEETCQ